MEKQIFFLLILTLIFILIFNGCVKIDRECQTNSDCVKQQITCCPCSMGGIEKCIPKNQVDNYTDKLKKCPKNLMCTALYNCKIEKCICKNYKCIAINKTE